MRHRRRVLGLLAGLAAGLVGGYAVGLVREPRSADPAAALSGPTSSGEER